MNQIKNTTKNVRFRQDRQTDEPLHSIQTKMLSMGYNYTHADIQVR